MYPDYVDPLYESWAIPGDNPYNQSGAVYGAPSVFASSIWMPGYAYWSLPIVARPQMPLQPNLFVNLQAPPVPINMGNAGNYQARAARPSKQNDLALMNLKAPRF